MATSYLASLCVFTHLERNLSAHCPAVRDDGLHVGVLPVPTVELHTAASCQ